MRGLITKLVIALTVAVWFDVALAAGDHRSAIDRQAKRVAAEQERQANRFKALEAECAKWLKKIETEKKPSESAR